jgi:hypothetical protein
MSDWNTANSRTLNIAKTRCVSNPRKTNILIYKYQLCHATIMHKQNFESMELGISSDLKLYFNTIMLISYFLSA